MINQNIWISELFEGPIIFGQKISVNSQRILIDSNKHFLERSISSKKKVTLLLSTEHYKQAM